MILCRIILILKQLALISGKNHDHLLLRCIKSHSRQSLLIWGKMGSNEPSFCNQFDWAIKMQLWKRWLPLSCFYHFILPSKISSWIYIWSKNTNSFVPWFILIFSSTPKNICFFIPINKEDISQENPEHFKSCFCIHDFPPSKH